MSILTRDFFLSLYKKINLDKDYNNEDYNTIIPWIIHNKNFYDLLLNNKILNQFDKDGFSLIQFESNTPYSEALRWSTHIIGPATSDSANYGKSYSKIIAEKNAKYFANTNYTQPLHTDDAHVLKTPRIIALFCEKQAKQGGITTLVKFSDIYSNLEINELSLHEKLYANDAIHLEGVKGSLMRPFFYHLEHKSLGVVMPAFLLSIQAHDAIIDIFKQTIDLSHQLGNQIRFKLQPGQLLIIDNFKILHGRTKFKLSEKRVLYRFCFEKKNVLHKL